MAYLLPSPNGPERIEESDILEEVRVQPKTRRDDENGNAEENQTEDGHGEEETDQTQHAHAEIPDTLTHDERPQREHHDGEDSDQSEKSVELLLPLRTLIQPDVV